MGFRVFFFFEVMLFWRLFLGVELAVFSLFAFTLLLSVLVACSRDPFIEGQAPLLMEVIFERTGVLNVFFPPPTEFELTGRW